MYEIEIRSGFFIVSRKRIGTAETLDGARALYRVARAEVAGIADQSDACVTVTRAGRPMVWEELREVMQ